MEGPVFEPNQEGLEAILQSVPELVIVMDPEERIHYLNRAEAGYDPEDFVGLPARDLVPPESHQAYREALERLHRTGEPQEYEVEVILEDGFHAWYRTRMVPFGEEGRAAVAADDEGGSGFPVLLMARNVTELKAMEAELDRLRRLLPICSWCNKIQKADGTWEPLEDYLSREQNTEVSHGLCPDCFDRQMEGLDSPGDTNGSAA